MTTSFFAQRISPPGEIAISIEFSIPIRASSVRNMLFSTPETANSIAVTG